MTFCSEIRGRILNLMVFVLISTLTGFAGVSREIQESYKREYEDKALFIKIPVFSEKQYVYISGQNIQHDRVSQPALYKVGDQLRVLLIDFSGDSIKFKMSGIDKSIPIEIIFKFDSDLQDYFPNKDVFDRALQSTFTEGLKYTDIEEAQRSFVIQQFERAVSEIAELSAAKRESVLKSIAPSIPVYQDAQRDIANLKDKIQEISEQRTQLQEENRNLKSDLNTSQTELLRLQSTNSALQQKIDNSELQITKLGSEINSAKGTAQRYQKELDSLQRSLNLKVDANKGLATQIDELGQAMRKLQKDNENLGGQINSLQSELDTQQSANKRLQQEKDDLNSNNRKLQSTIRTLTSKEDSLAKKYMDLEKAKDKLDDFSQSVEALQTRVVEENNTGGFYYGKVNVYLKDVLIGTFNWHLPTHLNYSDNESGEASFSTESVDYVQITPEERHLLSSFGEKLKIRVDLASPSTTMNVEPEESEPLQEIAERDSAEWRWTISNRGTQDARFLLAVYLINQNSVEIPLFKQDHLVRSSTMVRQLRNHLQPIPLIAGIFLGFLLFGIVGIFRRAKSSKKMAKSPHVNSSAPPSNMRQKQL